MMNNAPPPNNHPTDKSNSIAFSEIFEIDKIQELQDLFAESHGVASIITQTDGTPITQPSNFTHLCANIIRKTEKGCENCYKSHALIGNSNSIGPIIQQCLNEGLWTAGVKIVVGGKHIANWIIGQVKNEEVNQSRIEACAEEIGVDKKEFLKAWGEVPVMSTEKLRKIAEMLFAFVDELSGKAFYNLQLKEESSRSKKALELLKESEEKYRLITENTADSLALLDLNLNYIFLSPSVNNLLGYTPEEMMTRKFEDISTPESWQMAIQILGEEMAIEMKGDADPKRSRNIITEQIRKDGKKIWVEATVSFVRDPSGHPINILAVSKDITERKLIENSLHESEEKFRNIFEHSVNGKTITSTGGKLKTNKAFCQMLGYSEDELNRLRWQDITHPESIKNDQDILNSILSGEKANAQWEKRYIHKNGSIVWVDIYTTLQRDNDGNPLYFITDISNITAKKYAEQALRESEWKFQALFQQGPIGVAFNQMIYDETGKPVDYLFLDANNSFIELTGIDPRGKTVKVAFPEIESDPNNWIGIYGEVAKTGKTIRFEQYFEFNDRWFDIVVYQYKSDQIVAAFQETTKRKKAEIALVVSENRWRRAVADSPIAIMIHDEDDRVIQLSAGWTKFSGYTIEDIPTLADWTERAYGERNGNSKEYIDKLFQINETVKNGEWIVTAKDGSKRIWDFQTTPLGKINGDKRILHSMAIDVTEQKRVEDLLRDSERFLQEAQTIANLGTYNLDVKTGFWTSSELLDEIFGIDADYVRSVEGWLPIIHPDWREIMMNHLINDVLQNRNNFNKEYQIIRQNDKAVRWVHGRGSLKTDENNQATSMLGTIQDITERKEAEILLNTKNEELLLAKNKAEESDRLKSSFLANMSHEIRTPLNSIIGFSELLNDPHFEPEQKAEFTQTIIDQGNNLLLIINDIMDLSMLESRQIVIRNEKFTVNKLLTELFFDFKTNAEIKGIEFQLNIHQECDNLTLENDSFRIKQILNNFISNALKFTSHGYIHIGCSLNKNLIEFFVKDSGIGIPAKYHDSVFERFRQVDNTRTRKFGGNGLGLAISKNIAEILGGTIRLESEEEKGSTFYFSLPMLVGN